MAAEPGAISGGDKIFLECARHWARLGHRVRIYTNESGEQMCANHGLVDVRTVVFHSAGWRRFGFAVHYLVRVLQACVEAMRVRLEDPGPHLVYSASDFWPDSLPAAILRRRNRKLRWMAAFHFVAPSPFAGRAEVEYRGGRLPKSARSLLYFLTQRMVLPLLLRGADFWVVATPQEKGFLERKGVAPDAVWVIFGGVDLAGIAAAKASTTASYDACFVGRLHIQKGVQCLAPVWEEVVRVLPAARLAVIGEGPLRGEVEREVARRNLSKNVHFLGYVDGDEKYSILKASRVFLHTALWDTGGMAAAEGMACGLPVVAFDLPGYRYIYPRGMLKAQREDAAKFAALIVQLLRDRKLHAEVQRDAVELVQAWDWRSRAEGVEKRFAGLFPAGQ